ncbi:MAG: PfkB family carbohydrate kinase [Candidatus Fermentibacteria bacterium]|nr:PfkB family carbohydrate kinase [Candidatus Fermentibacteria bacterium]
MSVLVVGSIALDTLTTPAGKAEDTLGGSAVYFGLAAGQLSRVRIVGVVGPDFPSTERDYLKERNVDIQGLTIGSGPTFRWEGVYGPDFGDARTIRTELGVFASFEPVLPDEYRKTPYVFLANIDPDLQLKVLDQVENPTWIAMDTMNLWIEHKKDVVLKAIKKIDLLFVNASEARQISGSHDLFRAGRYILKRGPKFVVIKLGANGVMVLGGPKPFLLPACPVVKVVDPTGAGDSFAAGMLGFLAGVGGELTFKNITRGLCYGAVTASFAISGFGVEALRTLSKSEIDERLSFYLSTNQLDRVKE